MEVGVDGVGKLSHRYPIVDAADIGAYLAELIERGAAPLASALFTRLPPVPVESEIARNPR